MIIKLRFTAQIKEVTGVGTDQIELNENEKLHDLIKKLVDRYGHKFENILFNDAQVYRNSNLIVVNQSQVNYEENTTLTEGVQVTLMSPISGG
jgi:MoaD family protein